jgi:hypothetical protein
LIVLAFLATAGGELVRERVRPSWPVSADPAALTRIPTWLDTAGTTPGVEWTPPGGAPPPSRRAAQAVSEPAKESR